MNETGLVIESLNVDKPYGTHTPDERPYLAHAQWAQYLLDTCATIQDVIDSEDLVRVSWAVNASSGHFIICDRTGECIIIEWLDGELLYHTQLEVNALTNLTYDETLEYYHSGVLPFFDVIKRAYRFSALADMLKLFHRDKSDSLVDDVFDMLDAVSIVGLATTFNSIVYDQTNLKINFDSLKNSEIKTIDLAGINFGCDTPAQMLPIDADLSGEVTDRFEDYTREANLALLNRARVDFIRGWSDELISSVSRYPESFTCLENFGTDADNDTIDNSLDNCPAIRWYRRCLR